ncbi:glutaredoxin-C7-like [Phalaenopsis equestris]|uniref:glutaredoxin-C7-like n=1 Tax=Phalaenopsis equestris TaxID=78828 RepID=UPI0009E2BC7A|nr:glutaredoxin-C7-like [Phalaenopsis equestris]
MKKMAAALSLDGGESPEMMMAENPVVVFSRRSCCMCQVMTILLSMVGVRAKVVEWEEEEAATGEVMVAEEGMPVVFIGGERIGGLERLMGMHLSGRLVSRLKAAGASFH